MREREKKNKRRRRWRDFESEGLQKKKQISALTEENNGIIEREIRAVGRGLRAEKSLE